jgi:hypothetical protein
VLTGGSSVAFRCSNVLMCLEIRCLLGLSDASRALRTYARGFRSDVNKPLNRS